MSNLGNERIKRTPPIKIKNKIKYNKNSHYDESL